MLEKYGKMDRESKKEEEMKDDVAPYRDGKTTHKSDATGVGESATSRGSVISTDM